jgi:hypothetical protein
VASFLYITERQVRKDIGVVLDAVVKEAPTSLMVGLNTGVFKWRVNGCRVCGGDMYWDETGNYGGNGEYACILCDWRTDAEGVPVGQLNRVRMEKAVSGKNHLT